MFWLLANLWWLVPLVIGLMAAVFAFSGPGLPAMVALLRRVPWQVWAAVAFIGWTGLAVQCGRWIERSAIEQRQEAAEAKADAKADRVAKQAQGEAKKARDTIRKESDDAQAEVRTIVRTLPATCPSQPDRLRELGDAAVQGARGEVLPAEGR